MPVPTAPFKQPSPYCYRWQQARAGYPRGGHPYYWAGELLRLREALGLDVLSHPELLDMPQYAAISVGWFWKRAGLNALADKGDFLTITKRINGGTNGLADRQMLYERALKVLP